jgi:H+/Cl- antiporter ClcA
VTALRALLSELVQLGLLGLLVGLACWPFNLIDRAQDRLLGLLPAYSGGPWSAAGLALAVAPLLVVPLLLLLQRGPCQQGSGSGIPQTLVSLEDPAQVDRLLGTTPTLQRFGLWAAASLALLPLGREGPLVQAGAAVAQALRHRFPALLPRLSPRDGLALAAGAGLAGGFNTPLVGAVFVLEEFSGRFAPAFLWPALLVCSVAATFSNLAGQPMFALGRISATAPEILQVFSALPIGVLGGLVGAGFGRLLLAFTRRCRPLLASRPLALGLAVGAGLGAMALLSGGRSGGDGERLMAAMIQLAGSGGPPGSPPLAAFGLLLVRLLAPVLVLGLGIPGGLIDPALAVGALLGHSLASLVGLGELGMALGMAATLAGATQLPLLSVLFTLRLAADQQLLPGLLLAAVLAACVSRLLLPRSLYHALREITLPPAALHSPPR